MRRLTTNARRTVVAERVALGVPLLVDPQVGGLVPGDQLVGNHLLAVRRWRSRKDSRRGELVQQGAIAFAHGLKAIYQSVGPPASD